MLKIIPARIFLFSCVEKLKYFKIRKYVYRDTLRTARHIKTRETVMRISLNVWNVKMGIIYFSTLRIKIVAARSIRQSETAWSTAKFYQTLVNAVRRCFS